MMHSVIAEYVLQVINIEGIFNECGWVNQKELADYVTYDVANQMIAAAGMQQAEDDVCTGRLKDLYTYDMMVEIIRAAAVATVSNHRAVLEILEKGITWNPDTTNKN